jgi:hypothetical protein
MGKDNVSEWHIFYKRVTKYPWERAAQLLANEQTQAELGHLLVRYKQLKAEADMQLPHGPGLFKRLDKVSKELRQAERET